MCLKMLVHRAHTHGECIGDVSGRSSLGKQDEHLLLPHSQLLDLVRGSIRAGDRGDTLRDSLERDEHRLELVCNEQLVVSEVVTRTNEHPSGTTRPPVQL